MKRPGIPVLTTLRFPAAFAIVLYHFLPYAYCPLWIWEGLSAGVSFFYVLSGFILYYNYSDLTDRGFFWVTRLARIWPVHLATLVMVLCLFPFRSLEGHASWPITLPTNILLLHAWLPFQGSALSFNGVSWSLSVEGFFYLAFPWLLAVLNRRGAPLLLAASFGLGFIIILSATLIWPAHAMFVSTFNPMCRLFEFVLGMATCRFWMKGSGRITNAGAWLSYEALVLVISLAMVVSLPPIIQAMGMGDQASLWVGSEVCAVGFAALIWVFAHQAGSISRLLSKCYLTWFGEISFAVYMCHQIVLRLLDVDMIKDPSVACRLFAIYVFLTLGIAAAIFYLVETPARHAIVSAYKRWSARRARG